MAQHQHHHHHHQQHEQQQFPPPLLNMSTTPAAIRIGSPAPVCVDIKEFLWSNSSDLTSLPVVMGLFAMVYSTIVVTSLLGNLLVICSVCQHKSLQSVRNMFIVSLSVSDIVISVVSGTITPITAFTKIWPFGDLLCKLVPVLQGTSLCFSTLTLTSISVDRFLLIVTPLKPSIQKRCACRIVAFNSAIALGISLPMWFKQTMVDWPPFCGQFCTEDWSNSSMPRSIYGTFVFFTQFVIPFAIITSCYVMISMKINSGLLVKRTSTEMTRFGSCGGGNIAATPELGGGGPCRSVRVGSKKQLEEGTLLLNDRGSICGTTMAIVPMESGGGDGGGDAKPPEMRGRGGSGNANDAMRMAMEQRKSVLKRRLRTNRMLIAMVAVFFCCWAPSVLFNFLRDYQWLPEIVMAQEYLFGIITHCISMSSTIWNPVLYALLNEQFRTAFTEQFSHLRACLAVKKMARPVTPPSTAAHHLHRASSPSTWPQQQPANKGTATNQAGGGEVGGETLPKQKGKDSNNKKMLMKRQKRQQRTKAAGSSSGNNTSSISQ